MSTPRRDRAEALVGSVKRKVMPPEQLADEFEDDVEYHLRQLRARAKAKELFDAEQAQAEKASRPGLLEYRVPVSRLQGPRRPVPPFVLDDVLREGNLGALVSAPKTGKTLLVLDRALKAVTSGRRIVYFDAENSEDDINERLHDLGYGDADLDGGFEYFAFPSVTLDTAAGAEMFVETILGLHAEQAVDAVILDTASRFLEGDENDATPWNLMYRNALLPLKREGIGVLRLDHLGKDPSKGARGSSAKNADVDVVFELYAELTRDHEDPRQRIARVELNCTMQRSGHYPTHRAYVRSYIGGVLGHRLSGEQVGNTIVTDPGDTADQIIRALDKAGAPISVGRDKARELVGDQFPRATKRDWENAMRRRKHRGPVPVPNGQTDQGENCPPEPVDDHAAGRSVGRNFLPGQVRAGAGSSGVSAGQMPFSPSGQVWAETDNGLRGQTARPLYGGSLAAPGRAGALKSLFSAPEGTKEEILAQLGVRTAETDAPPPGFAAESDAPPQCERCREVVEEPLVLGRCRRCAYPASGAPDDEDGAS